MKNLVTMPIVIRITSLILCCFFCSCQSPKEQVSQSKIANAKGGLFIIGGGKRPAHMVDTLVQLSKVKEGYGVILPMASSEPDSAYYYANLQFTERGINLLDFNIDSLSINSERLDSLRNASLIYISGGDQRKFMAALNEASKQAIKEAYQKGAVIAGTSAGAAVMSKLMITGDEKKHPVYHSTFGSLEADNIQYEKGLGLLPNELIIDQHFIYRSRYNRLLTAILEKPSLKGIGIDESTAIYVKNDSAVVVGDWQVIIFRNQLSTTEIKEGLLGGKSISLRVYLPGQKFSLSL